MLIDIYSDGSCLKNPGPGGYAAIIYINQEKHIIKGRMQKTTNNIMEMKAVIEALKFIKKIPNIKMEKINLYSDSKYVILGITQWIFKWQKNNWHNSANKKIENLVLWQELFEISKELKISWQWVKAHSDNLNNNEVDKIARMESMIIAN